MNDILSLQSNAAASGRLDGQIESLKAISLRGQKKISDEQMRETAQQFEEIMIRQLLKEMRKTVPQNGIIQDSHATEMYMEMVDDNLAGQLADSQSLGISELIYQEMKQRNDQIVEPGEFKKTQDYMDLKNSNGDEAHNDFIPLEKSTETFLKFQNQSRMFDLPQTQNQYMPINWQRRLGTDQIVNR
ncbi:MAG: rod-binding protein [Candidatus Omnitrophica bacterium]|nr:rod-binding protein [Candidatus Omnitrophota bacterium]